MREQARAAIYRWLTPVWPMTAVGLLVGAVAGGLAAPLVSGGSPTATVVIRIDQPVDANQIVTNSIPSPETQQAYLAGEIVYLSSSGFASAVGNELKLPSPASLLATQQGQSTLVQITAAEPTADEATAALDTALKVYSGRVQQLASDRTGAAIDAITAVIERVRAETLADAARNDEVLDQHALDDKLRELEQQRLSLQSQQLRAPGIQVIEPITAQAAQSDPSLPIVGGAMLGGLVALAGTLAWRRRSGVIASVSHVDRQISPVLLPVVRLGKRAGSYARSELSRARTLYGQLPPPRTGEILVVGASQHSGTEVVAQLLYMGAMEHVSVTAMNVVGEFANLSSAAVRAKLAALPTDEEKTVIIDGGSVASAPQMLAVAERAGQIVVVVRIGRDVATEVEVLLHAIQNEDVPITAICTKGKLATAKGLFPARRKRSNGGRHSLGNRSPVNHAVAAAPIPSTPLAQGQAWPVEGSGSWVGQQVSWADQQVHEGERSEAGTTPLDDAPSDATTESSADQNQAPAADVQPEQNQAYTNGLPPAASSDAAPETPAADERTPAWEGQPSEESRDAHTNGPAQEALSDVAPETPADEDHTESQTVEPHRPHEHWAAAVLEQHGEQAGTPADRDDDGQRQTDQHAEHSEAHTNGPPHEALSEAIPETPADEDHAEAQTVAHPRPHEHWVTAIFVQAQDGGEQADEHHPNSANGVVHDAPSTPALEAPAVQTRSFGTGIPQRVQLRRDQVQAQDDLPRDDHTQPEAPADQNDGQVPDNPSQPELPADENGHRRPWLSLLRRKPSQDEPQGELGKQPENQDHTHA
jgi:hypothetical protein